MEEGEKRTEPITVRLISKEQFCEIMDAIHEQDKLMDSICKSLERIADIFSFDVDNRYRKALEDLLVYLFDDTSEWIGYWMYEAYWKPFSWWDEQSVEHISNYVTGSKTNFGAENFYDTVQLLAKDISKDQDEISLENKLIVSIATRLSAEMHLKSVIIANGCACPDSDSNQMRDWYNKAKPFLTNEEVSVIDQINLITPETIHLNAFMYEPLIDVSIWSLNHLFERITNLLPMQRNG